MLNKQKIQELLSHPGETRGVVFKTDASYVLHRHSEEGLKKLEKAVEENQLDINYHSPKTMHWYPIGLRVVSLLLIKDIFNYSDEDIRKIGEAAPRVSFVAKLFFKLFLSLEKLVKEAPIFWKEHHTVGALKVLEFSEKKNYVLLELTGVALDPIFSRYLEGYFSSVMALAKKIEQIKTVEVVGALEKGTQQFQITWK